MGAKEGLLFIRRVAMHASSKIGLDGISGRGKEQAVWLSISELD
jgi:hypothetical protein